MIEKYNLLNNNVYALYKKKEKMIKHNLQVINI